jgi:hypothetical protein
MKHCSKLSRGNLESAHVPYLEVSVWTAGEQIDCGDSNVSARGQNILQSTIPVEGERVFTIATRAIVAAAK